jgi:hypothetical protein
MPRRPLLALALSLALAAASYVPYRLVTQRARGGPGLERRQRRPGPMLQGRRSRHTGRHGRRRHS